MTKRHFRLDYKAVSIVFILMILFGLPQVSRAELIGSDVIAVITPEIPGPNTKTTIKLTSYAIDLNSASITWKVAGKTVLSQTGAISYSFTTGASGSNTVVEVVVTFNGSTLVKTISVTPTAIDLIWEAVDSYVPPFYRGKALPSSEAVIKVVGVPDIKVGSTKLDANDLTFTWERNFSALPLFSGFAKNSLIFKTSYLNSIETISLKVNAVGGSSSAEKSTTIRTGSPLVLFYEYGPLSGTNYRYDLAQYFSLRKDETTIVAEPYFFSPKSAVSADLKYEWSINGSRIPSPTPKNMLVVKKPAGVSGNAFINLDIESTPRLFQSAEKTLTVNLVK